MPLFVVAAFVCIAAASASSTASGPATPQTELNSVRDRLAAHFATVQQHCHCASALQIRLESELAHANDNALDASAGSAQAGDALLATLEDSMIDQLISGQARALSAVQGTGAVLLRSSFDKTLQPLSVFVPTAYSSKKSLPLVIMLHGADQSENALMATPQLRRLADQSGALLAIPWARGDDATTAAASADVYDALDALESNFPVDHRRVYLAGISLGAIALFKIGPLQPQRWSGFLSIAGTMTNEDMAAVRNGMRGKPIFLVAGGNDTFVKPAFVRAAASWMAANGIESRYYEQPSGEDTFVSLDPTIERAWQDMISGGRMNGAPAGAEIPTPNPLPSQKN